MGFVLKNFVNSSRGRYVFSILLGFGLATFFRTACNSRNCLVFKAPSFSDIKNKIYDFNNKCYKFTEQTTTCSDTKNNNNIKVVEI